MSVFATDSSADLDFLWLEITGRCQLECTHCYAESSPLGTHGAMTSEDWQRTIDQAANVGVRTVQFIGGEPTLHPALPELINHALSGGLVVEVFTNLVHITPQMWTVFRQPGVSLATSYYSDDPAQHAEITRRPTYERTRAHVAKAIEFGIPLRAGVIDVGDGQRVDEARRELVDLGVPRIGYDRLREVGRGALDSRGSAAQLCGNCGNGVAAIGPDGSVRPCVFSRWTAIGNVRTASLAEIRGRMPEARASLLAQGMRPLSAGMVSCSPESDGTNCYPHNRAALRADCYPHDESQGSPDE